jgi:uncharacterized peroxidase-related enzyme
MAFIKLKEDLPGIIGLIFYKKSTGKALCHFTQAGLRGPSPLSVAERELIAAYVSSLNECNFCVNAHGAVVNELMKDNGDTVSCAINNTVSASVSPKMRALLNIAGKVQQSGRNVTPQDISAARDQGATDEEIHDTVYVAASFCFFNRYVDGLGTVPLKAPKDYVEPAKSLVRFGYSYPNFIGRFMMKKMFRKAMTA